MSTKLDDARAIRQVCLAEQTTYLHNNGGRSWPAAEGIRRSELSEKVRDLQHLQAGVVD